MSCKTMWPSSFERKRDNSQSSPNDGRIFDSTMNRGLSSHQSEAAASLSSTTTNSSVLRSILATQDQQRRNALLLAATSLSPPTAESVLGSSHLGFNIDNNAAAGLLMAAAATERERALLSMLGVGWTRRPTPDLTGLGGLDLGILGGSVGGGNLGSLLGNPSLLFGGDIGGLLRGSDLAGLGLTAGSQGLMAQTLGYNTDGLAPLTSNSSRGIPASSQGEQQQLAHHDKLLSDAIERNQGRSGRTGTFPQKLHQMLSDLEEQDGGTEIASFIPGGNAFAIHKPDVFAKDIMPKYFRMSRFSSFQRQLNLYEFARINDGPNKGAYFHDLFHKGRPVLASQIRRNKIKGDGKTNSSGISSSRFQRPDATAAPSTFSGPFATSSDDALLTYLKAAAKKQSEKNSKHSADR